MTRVEIQQKFVTRFGVTPPTPSPPIAETDLDRAEFQLGIVFPRAYRQFVLTYGPVWTPNILQITVDHQCETWDISWFFTPSECVEDTRLYRSGSMSERLVAFASDCMGNSFCFDQSDLFDARPDDAAVWFFDHDYCQDSKLSDTFDQWLTTYVHLP